MESRLKNSFIGEDGLLNFLNPHNMITPLVELPKELNPYFDDNIHIYIKMLSMTPLTNVKSLPAWNMINQAYHEGNLKNINTIIENSSGNTAFSLGIFSRLVGIDYIKAVVSHQVSSGKLKMLRFFGIEPIVNEELICPDPSDPNSGIYKAKKWSQNNETWFNPGQYDNLNNPQIHKNITGKQIWEQTEHEIQVFVTGLGTTGTMLGTGSFLKEQNKNIRNIGIVRAKNNPIPGPRTQNLLEEIAFDWNKICDDILEVGTFDSYRQSLELSRNGLLVGPSTGFNVSGLLKYLEKIKKITN